MATEFQRRVLSIVRRIPPGRVATYGDIAELAGAPRAARAVGTVMRDCRDPGIPCHRVIAAGGGLGGFGGNLQIKRERLRAEGVEVGFARVRRFGDIRWPGTTNTKTIQPLRTQRPRRQKPFDRPAKPASRGDRRVER